MTVVIATAAARRVPTRHPARRGPFHDLGVAVRDVAPKVILFANLGAVQLNYGVQIDDARRLIDAVGAQGLYLHLNPLQEALQRNGDTNFRNLEARITALCAALDVPVIAKSVGSGIAPSTAARLVACGVAAFADWGYATPRATAAIRDLLPQIPLVASGGIRDGVQVAKALAMGADLAGLALPFLRAAEESEAAVAMLIDELVTALRIAAFASGSRTVRELRDALA